MWFEIKNLFIQLLLTAALLLSAAKLSHAGQFIDCMTKHKGGRNSQMSATACSVIATHPKLTMEEFIGCTNKVNAYMIPTVVATACTILTTHREITLPQYLNCMSDFIKSRSALDLPSSDVMAANACTLILLKKITADDFGACIDRYVKSTESTADEGSLACTVIHDGKIKPKEFLSCIDKTNEKYNYSDSISAEACKSLSGEFTI